MRDGHDPVRDVPSARLNPEPLSVESIHRDPNIARSEMKAGRFQGLRALFGKRDFRKLCVAQVFGGMGEWLATLALIGLVYDRTHSAFISGIVLASRILPAALIGSLLSAFVDRFDRRKVLIACTAGRATIYGILPI